MTAVANVQMMKVRHKPVPVLTMVDSLGTYGGAETMAMRVAMALDRSRFSPTLCVTRWQRGPEHEETLQELSAAEVPFIGLGRRSRIDLRPWRRLIERMRADQTTILHTHKVGSNIWGALLGPRAGVPILVAHEHSWSYEGQPYRRLIDRHLIARRADAFVAVSAEDRRRMVEVEKIPWAKTRLITNGIPGFAPQAYDGDRLRSELGLASDQPLVGIVATIRPEKAIDVLLRAFAEIVEEVPDAHLVVAGGSDPDEPYLGRYLALVAELGLGDRVHFIGHRTDIADVVRSFDVAVLCSDREGGPLTIMEYMELGKPVVATRVGGVPDIVVDGETGLLVPRQDPGALAGAIVKLLRDPERAAQMGAAGRARRQAEFSIESTTRAVEELYEELLAARDI